tara:strand:- start:2274 stop:3536 length:1263 start_codon:yes stop_codon:yes gene_type:complete
MIDVQKKILSTSAFILYTNIVLIILILTKVKNKEEIITSINQDINRNTNKIYDIFVIVLGVFNLICLAFLLNKEYYKELINGEGRGVLFICLFYFMIYIYHTYISLASPESPDSNYKKKQINHYIYKIISLIFLFIIIIYIGKRTHVIRGKYGLTLFTFLYILYLILKLWDFTDEYDMFNENITGTLHRYIIIYSILIIFFLLKLVSNIKIYELGEYTILFLLLLYNFWIFLRGYSLISKFSDILFPFILFVFFCILNFKDFKDGSVNTKFVYGIGLIITLFLIYIIINTEDIKIKSFTTIFLVVIYNILAIIYGSKDCDINGLKLLKRSVKWSILVIIITFILWKNIFNKSLGDDIIDSQEEKIMGDSNTDEAEILQSKLRSIKKNNTSEIKEENRNDERAQIQSRLNRLYESRARRDL